MGFLNWLSEMFSDTTSESSRSDTHEALSSNAGEINPATGLPMVDGKGGVDVEGNPYGTGFSDDDISTGMDYTFSSSFDDSFGGGSGFDDW